MRSQLGQDEGDGPNFDEMEYDIGQFASDQSVNKVLMDGIDLNNYYGVNAKDLAEAELASLDDYLSQVDNGAQLRSDIKQCDSVLAEIEEIIEEFQNSLGQLSTDICALQTRSETITTKLKNRTELEKDLGEFTRTITLPKEFISTIVRGYVDPTFVKALEELHKKLAYVKRSEIKETTSAQETILPLSRLRMKASNNARNWIVDRVNELKESYGTEQLAIQHKMMQNRFLLRFLKENSPDVEASVRDYYSAVMGRIYRENFRMLTNRITKQMSKGVMAKETFAAVTQGGWWASPKVVTDNCQFFVLGERARLLNDLLAPPQPFGDGQYPVEAFYRSLYQIFIDAVTAEHHFASIFFIHEGITADIFAETSKFLDGFIESLVAKINDPICIVMLLRITQAHIAEMGVRKISKVDGHLSSTKNKLISRLRSIITTNISALQNADAKLYAALPENHLPCPPAKRFGDFAASATMLLDDECVRIVAPELTRAAAGFDELLRRIAKEMGDPVTERVCLANNYFLILVKLQNASGGPLFQFFEAKSTQAQVDFVDAVLSSAFPQLTATVGRCFASDDPREAPIRIDITEKDLKDIATDFREKHTSRVKSIIDVHKSRFKDAALAQETAQAVVKKVAFTYARFESLVKVNSKNGVLPSWWSQMTTPAALVADIRPLAKAFS